MKIGRHSLAVRAAAALFVAAMNTCWPATTKAQNAGLEDKARSTYLVPGIMSPRNGL